MASKLWQGLFHRNVETVEASLHSAGATVRHRNPFEDLKVFRNDDELTKEFAAKWVSPFYMRLPVDEGDEQTINLFAVASREIDLDIATKLLGNFDWRSRSTAAYFAAINNYTQLEDLIGRHLLKSEVCYAGATYCLTLATFGTPNAKDYLKNYLEYYLERKDLWFDQADAMCALEFIDKEATTQFREKWKEFIKDKENWDLNSTRKYALSQLNAIQKIKRLGLQS